MTSPGSSGLVAWWKCEEVSGTRYDESINGKNLLAGPSSPTRTNARNYLAKYCATFNYSLQQYLYSTDTIFQGGNFSRTISFWMWTYDASTAQDILAKWTDTSSTQEYIIHMVAGKIRFTIRDTSLGYYYVESNNFGTLQTNGGWYLVMVYFDAGANQIGVGVNNVWDTASVGTAGIQATSTQFRIGHRADTSGGWFAGAIDDVCVFNNRLFNSEEKAWFWNEGHGRRYNDLETLWYVPVIDVITEAYTPPIYVYNSDLDTNLGVIEDYSSLNWSERYNEAGEFELELPLSYAFDDKLDFGNFLYIPTSDKVMIIEEKKPTRTPTDAKLLVNGRSAEIIMDRRVLLQDHTHDTNAEYLMYFFFYWTIINPSDTDRVIDLFEDGSGTFWPPSMGDSETIAEQFEDETAYEAIVTIAKKVSLGFKVVIPNLASVAPKLYFYTYAGVDRSLTQSENPYVIFSEKFDNLPDSSFLTSIKDKMNTCYVITKDAVYDRTFVWVGTEPSGLNRYEKRLHTEINRDTDGDDIDDLTDAEVLKIIQTRGEESIKENIGISIFDGDVYPRGQFVLGEDYFLGDIVEVQAHGISEKARITEVVKSYTSEGEKIYINFDFNDVPTA